MQNSLRFRLILILITLAIGPLLLAGLLIGQRSFTFEQNQAYNLQNQVAQNVAASIETVFTGINNDLNNLGNEIRGLENPDQAQQLSILLRAISSGTYSDFYEELTLLDQRGQEIVRLSQEDIVTNTDLVDRSSQEEFIIAVANRSTYYSPVNIDPNTGKASILISNPLFVSRSTNLSGVLIAKIRLDAIGNIINSTQVGENQTVYLTDGNGRVLAHQDRAFDLKSVQIQLPNSTNTQNGVSGENVILSPHRIQLGDQALYVVAEKPVSVALEIGYTIIYTIALVIVAALIIAGILGYLAVQQIVIPIEGLASLAERVAEGDLTQRASINRLDEIGTLANSFNSMTSQLFDLVGNLEQRVEDRTKALQEITEQLKTIADLARSVSNFQEVDLLLTETSRLISKRFGYYHVGIFLLDDSQQYAVLRGANSEGGQRMLARGHRLKVGEQGIVGFVTFRGKPRVVLNVGEESVYFNNPDLPQTLSEVALPLRFGNEIIGALDIQSTEANAFSQEDIEVFTILADQVSVAIQNVRSLEQAKRALQEAEFATRQLTGIAWRNYTEKAGAKGVRYDGIKVEPINKRSDHKGQDDALTIPVQLRGQTIGRLKLRSLDASRNLTDDELAVIESTANRVALALDAARLLEDAQKRATRESFLAEIGSKLSTSFQLDSILRDTVEELGQTLKGSTVTFQLVNPLAPLKSEDDHNGSDKKNRSSA